MAYDAATFLEGLFSPQPSRGAPDGDSVRPADLPLDWHFEWDERAAIMEYDGEMTRERAEARALTDILARMRGQRA